MILSIKALMRDTISWFLLLCLVLVTVGGFTSLFNRNEWVDRYRERLYMLKYDIAVLEKDLEQKKEWLERLKADPTAWEQVAREKMNYLGPDEVLVTFVPERNKETTPWGE